ncbi:MAG: DUF2179 domain-containing protein [Candidatus Aminicenantes bacterium]|nr:DUF2179 domain-containing protein [Candidatus Aminicenantes bacterium]
MFEQISNSPLFPWVVLPLLIFTARIIDVSLGTLRIIFISRDKRFLAPLMGFFEVLIWLLAISQIFKNLANPLCYIAYAAGFAGGNFVGMAIENRLAIGMQVVRVIAKSGTEEMISKLKARGYGLTVLEGEGAVGPVKVIFTIIKRKDLPELVAIIQAINPKAFYTVEDVRRAKKGVYPLAPPSGRLGILGRMLMVRKGK